MYDAIQSSHELPQSDSYSINSNSKTRENGMNNYQQPSTEMETTTTTSTATRNEKNCASKHIAHLVTQ